MEMFDPEFYRKFAIPDDLTLGECKAYMITTDEIKELFTVAKTAKGWKEAVAKIHYWLTTGVDDEAPDTMTLGEFRSYPGHHISIDIGEGGAKAKPKVPELT
jgi:hypothetical protein